MLIGLVTLYFCANCETVVEWSEWQVVEWGVEVVNVVWQCVALAGNVEWQRWMMRCRVPRRRCRLVSVVSCSLLLIVVRAYVTYIPESDLVATSRPRESDLIATSRPRFDLIATSRPRDNFTANSTSVTQRLEITAAGLFGKYYQSLLLCSVTVSLCA